MAGAGKLSVPGRNASDPDPSDVLPFRKVTLPVGIPAVAAGGATVAVSFTLPGSCRVALLLVSVVVGVGVAVCASAGSEKESTSSPAKLFLMAGPPGLRSVRPAERRSAESRHRRRTPTP